MDPTYCLGLQSPRMGPTRAERPKVGTTPRFAFISAGGCQNDQGIPPYGPQFSFRHVSASHSFISSVLALAVPTCGPNDH